MSIKNLRRWTHTPGDLMYSKHIGNTAINAPCSVDDSADDSRLLDCNGNKLARPRRKIGFRKVNTNV